MGIYAVVSDIYLRDNILVYLTRDEGSTETTADDTVTNKAIDDAEAEANGYIGVKYDLPLKMNIPPFLRLLTVRIAIYYLWINKKLAVPTDALLDYERSIKKLEAISRGQIMLGADTADEDTAIQSGTEEMERA